MSKLYVILTVLFCITPEMYGGETKQGIVMDKQTQVELKGFYLELDLSKITMVKSYSPGFDYQGFSFYIDEQLLLNAKVVVDYPKFPSKKVPSNIEVTFNDDIECFEWKNNQEYFGECIVKYAYIKKYDLSLYAHFSFEKLSLQDRMIALKIISSINRRHDL